MLDAKAFGGAAAVVTLVVYAVCVTLAIAAPDLLFGYASLTTHGLNLEPIRQTAVNLEIVNVVWGAVLTAASSWVVFYLGASFYNNFRKVK